MRLLWPPPLPRLWIADAKDLSRFLTPLRAVASPQTKPPIWGMLLLNACANDAGYECVCSRPHGVLFVTKGSPLLPNLGLANIHG